MRWLCVLEPPATHAAYKARRIPWQTPHTFEQDGKLKLTKAAEDWFATAVKERNQLAEEVRAEAGESQFRVAQGLRAKWLDDQSKQRDLQGWLERDPEAFRKSPADGLIERLVGDSTPGTRNGCRWCQAATREDTSRGNVGCSCRCTWAFSEGTGCSTRP